jgi:hypothetical protein
MNDRVLPIPKGMPPRAMGMAGWMEDGRQVRLKMSWPSGVRSAPMHITRAVASGEGWPVRGSFLGEEMMRRRQTGSRTMARSVPMPIPRKERPVWETVQPRWVVKTIG